MVGIPRRRSLPSALGIIRSRTGSGRKLRSFSEPRSAARNSSTPVRSRDGRRRAAVHPGRPCALVAPHPIPRHQQERGIGDEVEQVIEPAMRIIARPTVQLGLDLQYPALGPHTGPAPARRYSPATTSWSSSTSHCRLAGPLRHVTGFPVALGLLRGLRPTRRPSADDGPARRPSWLPAGKGDRGWFPRSPQIDRRGRRPALPLQHRHGYAAGLHRGLPTDSTNRLRSSPPDPSRRGHALHPGPYPPGLSRCLRLTGLQTLVPRVHLLVSLAGPAPSGSAGPSRVVRAASHPPRRSPDQAALSFTGRCDGPAGRVLSPPLDHISASWRTRCSSSRRGSRLG